MAPAQPDRLIVAKTGRADSARSAHLSPCSGVSMTVADRQAKPLEIATKSFSAKLPNLGLREETIGYGPTKEKWEAWNRDR
mgnify:CR=1 FL=1